jgi:hypothetical protein
MTLLSVNLCPPKNFLCGPCLTKGKQMISSSQNFLFVKRFRLRTNRLDVKCEQNFELNYNPQCVQFISYI